MTRRSKQVGAYFDAFSAIRVVVNGWSPRLHIQIFVSLVFAYNRNEKIHLTTMRVSKSIHEILRKRMMNAYTCYTCFSHNLLCIFLRCLHLELGG